MVKISVGEFSGTEFELGYLSLSSLALFTSFLKKLLPLLIASVWVFSEMLAL